MSTSTAQPVNPPVVQPGTGNNIIVNPCQRGNPILQCIKNVGKEFGDIVVDYQVGRTTGVLFLSLKYHRLHPEYIHQRIEKLGRSYNLRVLLLMCDVNEHQEPIRELAKTCLINNITVMVAWSAEEAGFYLSTYKQFEHKPPDLIKERVDKDYYSMLRTTLTSISKVNKTDVETLVTSLGSLADIAKANSETLQNLPGFGQVKVKRLKDAFEKPLRNNATSTLSFYSQSQPAEKEGSGRNDQGKGKQKEMRPTSEDDDQGNRGTSIAADKRRERSPVWDIELDLNGSPSPSPESGPPPGQLSRIPTARSPSPVWDIELDLLKPDDDVQDKRLRDFGKPSVLLS